MKKILSILIICLFLQNTYAQKKPYKLYLIYKVNKPENFRFNKNEFLFKDTTGIYNKLEEIKSLLIQKSYLEASIDSLVNKRFDYYAYLHIGKQYYWQLNTDSIPVQALKSADIKPKTFSQQKININAYLKKRQKLLNYFDNKGYPFTEIKIDNMLITQNFIKGNLQVTTNQKFYIDTIYIKGKVKIAHKFIFHNIGIKPGDLFSGDNLVKIDENIRRLNFLTPAKPADLEFFPAKVDLYLYLKKQKSNYFSGILGFANTEKDNSLKLTGNIALDLNNSLGIGEKIALRWDAYADSSQYLKTLLEFPYLFFVPLGLSADFELDKTTLDYLNTGYSFSVSYDFTAGNGINMYYRRKQSFLINTDTSGTIANSENTTFGMQVRMDNTNRLFVPRRGYKISIATGYGNRSTQNQAQETLLEANFHAAYYQYINRYFNLLFRNVSAGIFNKTGFYENEMFKLGGIQSLRGFDEKSILASAYTIFTLEMRFFIAEYSYLSAFTDLIYYQAKSIGIQSDNYAFGIGSGINLDTKAGILSLNFAVGRLNLQPFRFSNTKIHIGYTARF